MNKMRDLNLLLVLLPLIFINASSITTVNRGVINKNIIKSAGKVNIFADSDRGTVSRLVYGQMVEHAYWSIHLGLWTQLLDNGSFELDRQGVNKKIAQGWRLNSTHPDNKYSTVLDSVNAFNSKYSQKLSVTRNPKGHIIFYQNDLFLKKDVDYTGFLFIRGSFTGKVTACLLSLTKEVIAEQDLSQINNEGWKKVQLSLHSYRNEKNASFAILIKGEGDIWIDQVQLYPSDSYQGHGTRADIVNLYKDLKPAFMRWPGGSYLMWHHWKHGIGPLESRFYGDGRILKGHDGEWDPNLFGTDEFIQFCRDLNTEPMINVNIKDGLQNTLDWIEYCNGGVETKWGALRAKYGHKEPYNVKYWVVDNEPLVSTIEKGYTLETFPGLSAKWAREMKGIDSTIIILLYGSHNINAGDEFNKAVISSTKEVIDNFCTHCYYDQSFDAPLQGMPYRAGERMLTIKSILNSFPESRDAKVAMPEWNPECNTNIAGNMGQALEAAQMFNELERHSAEGILDFASPCQLAVNTDRYRGFWLRSAMVQINSETAWTSPMYHVNKLFSNFFEPHLLKIETEGIPVLESHVYDGLRFPSLDINVTKSNSGKRMIIKVVNNSDKLKQEVEFNIKSLMAVRKIKSFDVSAESITAINTAVSPDMVVIKERELITKNHSFTYTFSPFSVSLFEIILE